MSIQKFELHLTGKSLLILSLVTYHSSLYLASGNPGKLREFRAAALSRGVEVEILPRLSDLPECVEDGASFEENARKKALHYSLYINGPLFSDDSGLCVDVLGGAPGVHSARYAGPDADDAANNAKLLKELARVRAHQPCGHYACVIALARRGKVLGTFEGRAEGIILDIPSGEGGFGYDPYFYFPPLGRTFAELTSEEKLAVSHRGAAFRQLLQSLPSLLRGR